MDEIERDLNLLVKNAHAFNEPGSQVYKVCVFQNALSFLNMSDKKGKTTQQESVDKLCRYKLQYMFLQDATAIKKTVVTKRLEIEHTLSGAKSSKRLR